MTDRWQSPVFIREVDKGVGVFDHRFERINDSDVTESTKLSEFQETQSDGPAAEDENIVSGFEMKITESAVDFPPCAEQYGRLKGNVFGTVRWIS